MIRFYDKPQREYEEEVALLENEDEVYKPASYSLLESNFSISAMLFGLIL